MCGRYYYSEIDGIRQISKNLYDMIGNESEFVEIRPEMDAPVFTYSGDKLRLSTMRWGFHGNNGKLIINAKSETLHERAMFSAIADNRRCLIPCSGYFEWRRGDGQ